MFEEPRSFGGSFRNFSWHRVAFPREAGAALGFLSTFWAKPKSRIRLIRHNILTLIVAYLHLFENFPSQEISHDPHFFKKTTKAAKQSQNISCRNSTPPYCRQKCCRSPSPVINWTQKYYRSSTLAINWTQKCYRSSSQAVNWTQKCYRTGTKRPN